MSYQDIAISQQAFRLACLSLDELALMRQQRLLLFETPQNATANQRLILRAYAVSQTASPLMGHLPARPLILGHILAEAHLESSTEFVPPSSRALSAPLMQRAIVGHAHPYQASCQDSVPLPYVRQARLLCWLL